MQDAIKKAIQESIKQWEKEVASNVDAVADFYAFDERKHEITTDDVRNNHEFIKEITDLIQERIDIYMIGMKQNDESN